MQQSGFGRKGGLEKQRVGRVEWQSNGFDCQCVSLNHWNFFLAFIISALWQCVTVGNCNIMVVGQGGAEQLPGSARQRSDW